MKILLIGILSVLISTNVSAGNIVTVEEGAITVTTNYKQQGGKGKIKADNIELAKSYALQVCNNRMGTPVSEPRKISGPKCSTEGLSYTCTSRAEVKCDLSDAERKQKEAERKSIEMKKFYISGYCGLYTTEDGKVYTDSKGEYVEGYGPTKVQAYQNSLDQCTYYVSGNYTMYLNKSYDRFLNPNDAILNE